MESDEELYKVFSVLPEIFFELTQIEHKGQYSFKSVVIKVKKEMDGLLEPSDENLPYYVVEFQNQWDYTIFRRTVLEVASLSVQHSKRTYRGVIIFGNPACDPKNDVWRTQLNLKNSKLFRTYYLRDLIKQLPEGHPVRALFQPFVEEDEETLEKNAATYYNQIEQANIPSDAKGVLHEVFMAWMVARFKQRSIDEVLKMIELAPLKETQFYRDVFAEGLIEGTARGTAKEIQTLEALMKENILTEAQFLERVEPLRKELKKLQAKLEK